MSNTRETIARGLSVVVTILLIGALISLVGRPGVPSSRMAIYIVLLGSLATFSTAGVFYNKEGIATLGACGLILLGFSFAASLYMYVFPTAITLIVSALLVTKSEPRDAPLRT